MSKIQVNRQKVGKRKKRQAGKKRTGKAEMSEMRARRGGERKNRLGMHLVPEIMRFSHSFGNKREKADPKTGRNACTKRKNRKNIRI